MIAISPIYIVSKGRWESRLTMKALDKIGIDYYVVVESSELDQYARHIDSQRLLVLPQSYQEKYDTCDNVTGKSKGPGAARNFAWDHSISLGHEYHWVMDDNLEDFHRLNENKKIPVRCDSIFKAAESFTQSFSNCAISGFNYYSFCKATDSVPAFVPNTRIYSCLYIKNAIPYRWRGRYNEDTDLSLRVLKDGLCTIQFNAFLCGKVTTQRMNGGNTKEFYEHEGTKAKSQMISDLHPDVASVVWKFNRWHHHVNYRPFKKNQLKRVDGYFAKEKINNYGMVLEKQSLSNGVS